MPRPFYIDAFKARPDPAPVQAFCNNLTPAASACPPDVDLLLHIKPDGKTNPRVDITFRVEGQESGFCRNGRRATESPGGTHQIDSKGSEIVTPVRFCRGNSKWITVSAIVKENGDSYEHPIQQKTIRLTPPAADALAMEAPAKAPQTDSDGLLAEPENLPVSASQSTPVLFTLAVPEDAAVARTVKFSIAARWNVRFEKGNSLEREIVAQRSDNASEVLGGVYLRRCKGGENPGASVRVTATLYDGAGNYLTKRYGTLPLQ